MTSARRIGIIRAMTSEERRLIAAHRSDQRFLDGVARSGRADIPVGDPLLSTTRIVVVGQPGAGPRCQADLYAYLRHPKFVGAWWLAHVTASRFVLRLQPRSRLAAVFAWDVRTAHLVGRDGTGCDATLHIATNVIGVRAASAAEMHAMRLAVQTASRARLGHHGSV
jgi:hypothetical protein